MMNILILTLGLALAAGGLPPMPPQPPQTTIPASVQAGKEDAILLNVKLPKGWKFYPKQWFIYRIFETSGAVKVDGTKRKGSLVDPKFPIKVPFTPAAGKSEIRFQVAFYYCPKESLDDAQSCKAFSHYYLYELTADAQTKTRKIPLPVEAD